MKSIAPRPASRPSSGDARTDDILRALRDARKTAVRSAKLHKAPVVYLRAGTLVRERV